MVEVSQPSEKGFGMFDQKEIAKHVFQFWQFWFQVFEDHENRFPEWKAWRKLVTASI